MLRSPKALLTGCALLLAVASAPRPAAGAAPTLKEIKKQYWQVLPGISWAYPDNRGNVWLASSPGASVEASYTADLKLLPPINEKLVLGDRHGRLWFRHAYQGTKPSRYYDGTQWRTLSFYILKAFEDSAGRVFLFGPSKIHVLDQGRWRDHRHHPTSIYAGWRLVEDPAGRVWAWSHTWSSRDRAKRPHGIWCYEKGAWTHLTARSGFAGDLLEMLIPLEHNRFLVILNDGKTRPNYVVWAWKAAGGREVPEAKRHELLPGYSARQLRYVGTDGDGNHFVSATYLRKAGQIVPDTRDPIACFSAKGVGRLLTVDRREFRATQRRYSDRLYFVRVKGRTLDGKVSPRPAVPSHILGVDRLGRIYLHGDGGWVVYVVWPACEKPGDVIRQRPSGLGRGLAFQGPRGEIWFNGGSKLFHWSGEAWAPTPVQRKPHPRWTAHPAPPWLQFTRGLHVQPGTKGTVLAVTVRDVYQDIPRGPDGTWPDWREVRERGGQALAAGKAAYWLEGWLRHQGRWTGPMHIEALLRKHLATFLECFTVQTSEASFFDLQSDGKQLWVAYDAAVYAFSPRGGVATWGIPAAGRGRPLPLVNLVCLRDGQTWCVAPGKERGHEVTRLEAAEGKIRAVPLPEAGIKRAGYRYTAPRFHVCRNGAVWCWHQAGRGSWQGRGARELLPTRDAWRPHKGLGSLQLEDPDGGVWFPRATRGMFGHYCILRQGKVTKVDLPQHFQPGSVSPAGPDRRLAFCGRYVVSFVRGGKDRPGAWTLGRVHLLADPYDASGVFLDGRGHIISLGGWSAPLPLAATPEP